MPSTVSPPPASRKDRGAYIFHARIDDLVKQKSRYLISKISPLDDVIGFLEWSVLNLLCSKPANFQWSMRLLRKESRIGETRLRKIVGVLKSKGHVRTKPIYRDGRFRGQLWEVTQTSGVFASDAKNSVDGYREHCSRQDIIEPESITSPLPSPGERDLEQPLPGEASEQPPAPSEGRQAAFELRSITLTPPCNWGSNPERVYRWVRQNLWAERFRQILGDGHHWTPGAARAFAKKFGRGGMRGFDILVMKEMGRGAINKVHPLAGTSLQNLIKYWDRLIALFGQDENGMWAYNRERVRDKNKFVSDDDLEWDAKLDEVVHLLHCGEEEEAERRMAEMVPAEVSEKFRQYPPTRAAQVVMVAPKTSRDGLVEQVRLKVSSLMAVAEEFGHHVHVDMLSEALLWLES